MSDVVKLNSIEVAALEGYQKDLEEAIQDDPMLIVRSLLTENDTLRTMAKRSHTSLLIVALYGVVASCAAFAGFSRDTEFRYFYINSKGHVYETRGMNYPVATQASVTTLATEIGTALHTFTYKNYEQSFVKLVNQCRQEVVGAYFNKLDQEGIFKAAKQLKQHYDGLATGARVVGQKAIDKDGRQAWRVNLKVNEDITGTMEPVSNDFDMTIDIEQVPLSENPSGLMCVRIDENYRGKR
ncbi:DotI/IcmL/TraM family protein [Cellvibrio sp. QJXJ]|uniref:DotI/IcmL/TraM family protein n=1 Tax=Cellvibrio sp. QJXJ TaxID=2964606 RepID=UPI0021C35963|nr:DotI/IcmL/TraM family protein [Cellvibrio sp. QJXJ]UUA75183.1 DotI/IcmL/TraM family protein [Cellvibrio sp. QJXJ]